MSRRSVPLLARNREEVALILGHPLQLQALSTIERLIGDLRALASAADCFDFQRELVQHILTADRLFGEARRNSKRQARGKVVGTPISGDWMIEADTLDRVLKQFRSVGDALAWRLFGFDRRFFAALSRNERPGPMYGKDGLEAELSVVEQNWKEHRQFSLMHDATNALRIGDLTRFTETGFLLTEVKKDPSGFRPEQTRRAQHAIDVLNGTEKLSGKGAEVLLYKSRQQLKTHLKKLHPVIEAATERGFASAVLHQGWVVRCISEDREGQSDSSEKIMKANTELEATVRRASVQPDEHKLKALRIGDAWRDPSAAPFAIYPFEPDVCARLTCDFLVYESLVASEVIAQALRGRGFQVVCHLQPGQDPLTPDAKVFTATKKRGSRIGVTEIHMAGLTQLLFELVEVRRYVDAIEEAFHRGITGRAMFAFANERAVWN